jgi:hypothetical protein
MIDPTHGLDRKAVPLYISLSITVLDVLVTYFKATLIKYTRKWGWVGAGLGIKCSDGDATVAAVQWGGVVGGNKNNRQNTYNIDGVTDYSTIKARNENCTV